MRLSSTQILLSFSLFFLIGCQPENNQSSGPTLFADLYVRYLQDTGESKATASFVLGDSIEVAKAFQPKGGVAFQGSGMGARAVSEQLYRYNWENVLEYPSNFQFRFKNQDGIAREYTGALKPISSISNPAPLSMSNGGSINIQNDVLENEKIVLLFNNAANKSASMTLNGPINGGNLQLSAAQIKALEIGTWTLYLVKKKLLIFEEEKEITTLNIEFYASEHRIDVVE